MLRGIRGAVGRRGLRVAAAAVAGGLFALAAYALSRAGAVYAFEGAGLLAGAAAGLGLDAYRRSVRLTEVRISVPQLSELTFVVNDTTQQVAWQLFVDSVTRVSVQRLKEDEGLLREALTSLYGLFSTTRDALRGSRPTVHGTGVTVEHLAVRLLNQELRPFLSKWHPRLLAFETEHPGLPESEWPDAARCRAELAAVQANSRAYVLGFARLAGVRDPEFMLGEGGPSTASVPGSPGRPRSADPAEA